MLTEIAIKAAVRGAKGSGKAQIILKDGGTRGNGRLALIVRPLASRVASEWYAIYYRDEKRQLAKVGEYPGMSLADARAKFRDEYAPTIRSGGHPRSEMARAFRTRRAGATVEQLFVGYIESMKTHDKNSWPTVELNLLTRHDSAANIIGRSRVAGTVKAADIAPMLADLYQSGRPSMAAHMRGYISAAFSFGLLSNNDYRMKEARPNWGIDRNPVLDIPADRKANGIGSRVLSEIELWELWKWCVSRPGSRFSASIRLQIVTGQRVTEVLRMLEPEFYPKESLYEWLKTKNEQPHALPLNGLGMGLMESIRPNAYGRYFPGTKDPSERATHDGVWAQTQLFSRQTGIPHFTPRDIRRTWKTLAAKIGIQKDIRDRVQNHALRDVASKHYDRYDYLPEKRAAVKTWNEYLTGIIAGDIKG